MISTYKRIILLCFMASCQWAAVNSQSWPTPKPEAKAGTRWWWLGSAVDKTNLQWNLSEYARAGIGAVEITPLYGVQGNDKNNIDFLSPRWMQALNFRRSAGFAGTGSLQSHLQGQHRQRKEYL